ncbi:MAG: hypothetical protein KJO79_03390, partial [Verrucomicrobiae bacterium]|nr:hypothetical protein [Verrucomicrobiae bacterium]
PPDCAITSTIDIARALTNRFFIMLLTTTVHDGEKLKRMWIIFVSRLASGSRDHFPPDAERLSTPRLIIMKDLIGWHRYLPVPCPHWSLRLLPPCEGQRIPTDG